MTAPESCGRNEKDERASGFADAGGSVGACHVKVYVS